MNELVVLGTVLTVDADRRTHTRGAVYIHDGVIERVGDAEPPRRPPVTTRAPRVRVDGVVAPGLIDLHNHLAYNTLPLWVGRPEAVRHALPVAARRDVRPRRVESRRRRSASPRPRPRSASPR